MCDATRITPDPDRLGGPGWLANGGGLDASDRLRMLGHSGIVQLRWIGQQLRRRRMTHLDLDAVLRLPDTPLVRDAAEAARIQGPVLLRHGRRTAVFARALALLDGADVDHELLCVAALLHDVGLARSVAGEDFTRRSADVAIACAQRHRPTAEPALEDAIVVHTTIGIRPDRDGPLGCYLQWGAMVDLVGLRERQLPYELVRRVVDEHHRRGFPEELTDRARAESRAVPGGRFALLRRTGFPVVVRHAHVPSRPT